jgi:hypothetical protein
MYKECLHPIGSVILEHYRDGALIDIYRENNLVVDVGLAFITSRLEGVSDNVMSHMSLGSGNTNADGADVDLEAMLGSRIVLDSTTRITTTTTNDTVSYKATFNPGVATGTIAESGIFNNSAGGIMLARIVFTPKVKGAGDTIVNTWNITFVGV